MFSPSTLTGLGPTVGPCGPLPPRAHAPVSRFVGTKSELRGSSLAVVAIALTTFALSPRGNRASLLWPTVRHPKPFRTKFSSAPGIVGWFPTSLPSTARPESIWLAGPRGASWLPLFLGLFACRARGLALLYKVHTGAFIKTCPALTMTAGNPANRTRFESRQSARVSTRSKFAGQEEKIRISAAGPSRETYRATWHCLGRSGPPLGRHHALFFARPMPAGSSVLPP